MGQHTDKQEEGEEGHSQPKVLLGLGGVRTVRNYVFDVKCNTAIKVYQIGGENSQGDTKESDTSCGRKDSVKQMISSLLASTCIERFLRLE